MKYEVQFEIEDEMFPFSCLNTKDRDKTVVILHTTFF